MLGTKGGPKLLGFPFISFKLVLITYFMKKAKKTRNWSWDKLAFVLLQKWNDIG
jgi:hypothetical protein